MSRELPGPHMLPIRTFLNPWSSKEAPSSATGDWPTLLAPPRDPPSRGHGPRNPAPGAWWRLLGLQGNPYFMEDIREGTSDPPGSWQGLPGGSALEMTAAEGWVGESEDCKEDPLSRLCNHSGERGSGREGESRQVCFWRLSCEETDGSDTFLLCFLPCLSILCILNNVSTGASHLELFLQDLLSAPMTQSWSLLVMILGKL